MPLEKVGTACADYDSGKRCTTLYKDKKTGKYEMFPDAPPGKSEHPKATTVSFDGRSKDVNLCFRRFDGHAVPGYCWKD